MPISMQILIFIAGLLTSSAIFSFVISKVQNSTIREVFMWLGLVIIISGLIGGLLSFIPAP
jgi:hypothetical protein